MGRSLRVPTAFKLEVLVKSNAVVFGLSVIRA